MVLADRAAVVVNEVFLNSQKYTGAAILAAVLCYSVQLYADFSGGIDVVRGVAAIFGIELDQNFRQPYFAVSITDFWHRWHITLGTWMKDYIFYPLSLSKGMTKFGKSAKKVLGKKMGRVMPVAAANIVVFLVVGVWHGAAWKYIVYGLYNGLIIAVSGILAPYYGKWFQVFHINPKSKAWHVVKIVRTFILVNISWYFDMGVNLRTAFVMMKNTVTGFSVSSVTDGLLLTLGLDRGDFLILAAGCLVVFIISLLKEKKIQVRESLEKKPLVIRFAVYGMLILALPFLGYLTAGEEDLSMHNSKRWIRAVVFLLLIAVFGECMKFALIPPGYMRQDMHNIKENKYDDIFVGTSHGFAGISPEEVDRVTGRKSTNLCLPNEFPIDSYYLVREACRYNKPKRVIYELDPGYWVVDVNKGKEEVFIYNEFPSSVLKLQYAAENLENGFQIHTVPVAFLPPADKPDTGKSENEIINAIQRV